MIGLSIERIFSRADLLSSDARAWHMMMRALGSTKTPPDFGLNPSPGRAKKSRK